MFAAEDRQRPPETADHGRRSGPRDRVRLRKVQHRWHVATEDDHKGRQVAIRYSEQLVEGESEKDVILILSSRLSRKSDGVMDPPAVGRH